MDSAGGMIQSHKRQEMEKKQQWTIEPYNDNWYHIVSHNGLYITMDKSNQNLKDLTLQPMDTNEWERYNWQSF